ncbi:MAG: threonine synthase [Verrucomicrobiota bacterium]
MHFVSTRSHATPLSFTDAFAAGLAPDGGLYLPESLPQLPSSLLQAGVRTPYPELAFEFLRLFDQSHSETELHDLVARSYASFEHPERAAPLVPLTEDLHVLELFHGPTLAFKDFGLQLVGHLFEDQIRRTGQPIHVLGATSGDTGAAAIHGLAHKAGVKVFILFPKGRVSPLQERQMTCTGAENIHPIPIEGSFDDAQRIVKELFGDLEFKKEAALSAVNSINLARVLAQSIYYLAAWQQLPPSQQKAPNWIVPTGNFGNILAGWLAYKMGLPAKRFVIATNRNDILHRLFTQGRYTPGAVHPSLAPSMDIQVASNFERYLFFLNQGDPEKTASQMKQLKEENALVLPDFDPDIFTATKSSDQDIQRLIAEVDQKYHYLADPHTACAFQDLPEDAPNVILSTAHPAKFPDTIEQALGSRPTHPTLEALQARQPVTYEVGSDASSIREFIRQSLP